MIQKKKERKNSNGSNYQNSVFIQNMCANFATIINYLREPYIGENISSSFSFYPSSIVINQPSTIPSYTPIIFTYPFLVSIYSGAHYPSVTWSLEIEFYNPSFVPSSILESFDNQFPPFMLKSLAISSIGSILHSCH